MNIEAMKLALEASEFEQSVFLRTKATVPDYLPKAITSLRNAIAEAEKHEVSQEPVAWIDDSGHPKHISYRQTIEEKKLYGDLRPLYTHQQPKREPLTDEEKSNLWEISRAALPRYATYANLIEAAHGIKGEA